MKQIRLKKLELTNFRGIQHLEIDFSDVTNIYGRNRAGKSTVANAFVWLLFGKDLEDRKDFELKPYSIEGETSNNVDVEVRAQMEINGYNSELRRVFRERWEKQRGHEVPSFKGNVTETFFDGIPLSVTEYNARINGIIDEKLFKLITNPLYFNNILKWQERRAVLVEMAGNITNTQVLDEMAALANKDDIFNLTNILNTYGLDDFRKKNTADKKRLSDELKNIPSRIDQAEKSKPEVLDWLELEVQIKSTKDKIAELDERLFSASKENEQFNEVLIRKQNEIHELKSIRAKIEFDTAHSVKEEGSKINAEAAKIRRDILTAEAGINDTQFRKSNLEKSIQELVQHIEQERNNFIRINASKFIAEGKEDEIQHTCPLCKRPHDQDKIEEQFEALENKRKELELEFNSNKTTRLTTIREKGKGLTKRKEELEKSLEECNTTILSFETKLQDLKDLFAALTKDRITLEEEQNLIDKKLLENPEYQELKDKILTLEKGLSILKEQGKDDNISGSRAEKASLNKVLEELTTQLAGKTQIERIDKQIGELRKQEKEISQQIAILEKSEFLIENFNRTKMNMVEQNINGFFEYVKFKLFDQQINGSTIEVCHTTYNGVKWDTLNTEGKLLAGLDVINALNSFYQVSAPIMLDNRESVTNIPPIDTQIINLIVSPFDNTLRIEHTENQFATV